jgi:NAD(P)-dependent dehydrogenase (short-subunit alcohol dehydrogenase family)
MAVNVRGVYLGHRAAIRRMRDQGGAGSTVATSSGLGARGGQLWGPYSAPKRAVLGLVRSAALECARDGIRVTALCPRYVDTQMLRPTEDMVTPSDRSGARAAIESSVLLGRYAHPAEQAGLIAWFLSSESSYSTGGYYSADGGVDAAAAGYLPPSE